MAGNPRIVNNIVDLGAYEYQGGQDPTDMSVVTTLDDTVNATDGVVSLREAISAASDGDTITFASSLSGGTITLSGTTLTIDKVCTGLEKLDS